jgi:hypothetical protein
MSRVDASRAVLVHCSATLERRTARAIDLMRIDDSDVPAMSAWTPTVDDAMRASPHARDAARSSEGSTHELLLPTGSSTGTFSGRGVDRFQKLVVAVVYRPHKSKLRPLVLKKVTNPRDVGIRDGLDKVALVWQGVHSHLVVSSALVWLVWTSVGAWAWAWGAGHRGARGVFKTHHHDHLTRTSHLKQRRRPLASNGPVLVSCRNIDTPHQMRKLRVQNTTKGPSAHLRIRRHLHLVEPRSFLQQVALVVQDVDKITKVVDLQRHAICDLEQIIKRKHGRVAALCGLH